MQGANLGHGSRDAHLCSFGLPLSSTQAVLDVRCLMFYWSTVGGQGWTAAVHDDAVYLHGGSDLNFCRKQTAQQPKSSAVHEVFGGYASVPWLSVWRSHDVTSLTQRQRHVPLLETPQARLYKVGHVVDTLGMVFVLCHCATCQTARCSTGRIGRPTR